MSLRAEIHDALDEVTPPAPNLEVRVTELFLSHAPDTKVVLNRGGRARWTKPYRGVVTLVAAALVVLLIGGLILSGRIWRDALTQPPRISLAQLKSLESRPLQLPVVLPGATCPTSLLTDVSAHGSEAFVFGVGPVYVTPLQSSAATTNWGTWAVLSLVVDTTRTSGPILIRGKDLPSNAMVVFARTPLNANDQPGDGIPTGRVMVLAGEKEQAYPELVIDTSRVYGGTRKGDWPIYKGYMGYPKAAAGCLGFQIDGTYSDGTNFTESVIVRA
jgi:hypothetical protein